MKWEDRQVGIVILYNVTEQLVRGEVHDLSIEPEVVRAAQAVAKALASEYNVVQVPLYSRSELTQVLAPYSPARWMVFNLFEGMDGRLFEESRIAWALEAMGYYFTGSGGEALARSTHKALAKEYLTRAGIPTPRWQLFRDPDEVVSLDLSFPAIVKPVAEDGSLGITGTPVVYDLATLRERVAYIVQCYHQAALVEEFVAGREFEVSLWEKEPVVLPVTEIDFSRVELPCEERILSFASKWDASLPNYIDSLAVCPASLHPGEREWVGRVAREAAEVIGYRGYARIDVRMAADGTPYVIDINCNPDLLPDGGFYWGAQAAGYSFEAMIHQIVAFARSTASG